MPILSNPRHERFAQELAKGKTSDEAYQLAGYSENRGNATRLKANESVARRVDELQTTVAARLVDELVMDKTELLREMAKIAKEPIDSEHVRPSAKRAALMDYARIEGWVVDRTERGAPGEFDRMTNDELRAYVAAGTDTPGQGEKDPDRSRERGALRGKPH